MFRRRRPSRVFLRRELVWERLNRLSLTQIELANMVGITSGYLSLLLAGQRRPGPACRRKLMAALGAERFEDLFGLEPDDAH